MPRPPRTQPRYRISLDCPNRDTVVELKMMAALENTSISHIVLRALALAHPHMKPFLQSTLDKEAIRLANSNMEVRS